MPDLDGFEVLKTLNSRKHSHFHGQPVFAMTGRRDLSLSVYRERGFTDVLRKPFAKQELLSLLDKWFPSSEFSEETGAKIAEVLPDTELFSMDTIYSFLGNDMEACAGIMETFITESESNLEQLKKAIKKRDLEAVNRTAHRMLPMFRQFRASSCIRELEILETVVPEERTWPELDRLWARLERNSKALLSAQETFLHTTSLNRSD